MSLIVLVVEDAPLPPALEVRWLSALPAARRAQLQGWPDAQARQRSLWGSRLLRAGLLRLGHPSDALLSLRYTEHGKPTLALPLDFSLAHCKGRILCAISTNGPVGVDIEPLGRSGLAAFRLYLSAQERERVGDDEHDFLSLWTQKEAVVKAGGTLGLRQMREFEMRGDQTEFAGHAWHTSPLRVHDAFVAHLAHARPWPSLTTTLIAPETLF